jgi:hypothetical protein
MLASVVPDICKSMNLGDDIEDLQTTFRKTTWRYGCNTKHSLTLPI